MYSWVPFYPVSSTDDWSVVSSQIEFRTELVTANSFSAPFLDKETHGDTKSASNTHERVERYHKPRYSRNGGANASFIVIYIINAIQRGKDA